MARRPNEPCSRAPPCSPAWPRYGPPVRSPRRKPHRPVPAAAPGRRGCCWCAGHGPCTPCTAAEVTGRRPSLNQACAIRLAGGALRSASATPTRSGDLRRRHRRRERDRLGVRLGVRAGRGRDPGWLNTLFRAPPGLAHAQPASLGFPGSIPRRSRPPSPRTSLCRRHRSWQRCRSRSQRNASWRMRAAGVEDPAVAVPGPRHGSDDQPDLKHFMTARTPCDRGGDSLQPRLAGLPPSGGRRADPAAAEVGARDALGPQRDGKGCCTASTSAWMTRKSRTY
jgi:hypothetical protein